MNNKDQDTDPSTPGARRSEPRMAAAMAVRVAGATGVAVPRPTTDPGLGPHPEHGPASPPPMVVVAPSASSRANDSVDVLLNGIAGPRPARMKTTRQTDGEAAAAYHAEHGLRPARVSPASQPKVLVERSTTQPGMRRREKEPRSPSDTRRAMERTANSLPKSVLPRVIVALGAGVAVVVALFILLRALSDSPSEETGAVTATPSTATAAVVGAAPPAVPPTETAAAPVEPPPPVETANTAVPTALPPSPASVGPRAKPRASGDGLGEFKRGF